MSSFTTEVLISNLNITGRDPLRDPSDVFIIGGISGNDLLIDVLSSDGPPAIQIPEFSDFALIIALFAGILIVVVRTKV